MKKFPITLIRSIPHNNQRYDTSGDYVETNLGKVDVCEITVSELNNWKMEALVAVHELIEYILVKDKGIKIKDIDKFDIDFENKRKKGNMDEPGDDKKAPYYNEHQIAILFEKELARYLNINWKKYIKEQNKL